MRVAAPLRRGRAWGSAGPRVAQGVEWGPEFGASLATFPRTQEGVAGGASGEAGGGEAFSAPWSLWGTSRQPAGWEIGELGPLQLSGESQGVDGDGGGGGCGADASSAAAGTACWAYGEEGHPPVGWQRGPGAPGGRGLGPDFCHLRGCRKLGLARRARNPAALNPQIPRMLPGRIPGASAASCPLAPCRGGDPTIPPDAELGSSLPELGTTRASSLVSPGPWASRVCVPSARLARARWLQCPGAQPPDLPFLPACGCGAALGLCSGLQGPGGYWGGQRASG